MLRRISTKPILKIVLIGIVSLLSVIACTSSDSTEHGVETPTPENTEFTPSATYVPGTYVANSSDFVAAADWDSMTTVTVQLTEMAFTPETLSFSAGQPYKLEIINSGDVKHYFTAGDFYGSVAFRKAQTSEGEYKAPYFTAIEVFPGDQIDLYFVPVIPGTYGSVCTISGHEEAGMKGHVVVAGETPTSPEPQMALMATGNWVQNASDLVAAANWDGMETVTVNMTEMAFTPESLTFVADQPYKLEIVNSGAVKHYFTATDFYQSVAFRKGQDGSGEIKIPYFKAVEVFPGEQADLYFIPTVTGTFDSICTIEGHAEAGMHGHIVVSSK